ncbi:MAG: 16S rRNA (adenine(1518)-N(6)/adenine(1519)-N(6))-dimethyltransferase RsmA [Lentimicrobiaceae bacterium]|jgi:16S rRNA (adenine1518-N6/adenine1519-N6)-dimethyltransferase|nr:16S rRNA (adenine(1518)-N(6)/adenine(1519)-N(6))-dimethyltransferase RsmA [Lentimicrobiaceae bacterium]
MRINKVKNFDKSHLNRFPETVKPKKSLGQHFLIDQNIAQKIVKQLSTDHDKVIEVGAGMGVLTQYLLPELKEKLVVVEIDSESVAYLSEHFPELRTNLIEVDFLRTKLTDFSAENIGIIGNFPYNISSQIFFHIIDYKEIVTEVVGMVQKEVAERLSSPPGKKAYGILSVLLQAWYDIEYLFTVNENVFNPPPKVKSAVIRLRRNNTKKLNCDEILFKKIIKQAFNQRRKTLRNSLRPLLNAEIIENKIFDKRPEQLRVDEFIVLTNLIYEKEI